MPMVKTVSYQKMGCLHPKQKLNPIFYKEFEMNRNKQKFHQFSRHSFKSEPVV